MPSTCHSLLVFLSSALCGLQLTQVAALSPQYQISMDGTGRMRAKIRGATLITPVKATAVFFDASRIGFWTGTARGSVSFAQANYPSRPATVINVALVFPAWQENRTYVIEVLFNGTLDRRYCQFGVRYIELHRFKLPANEVFYGTSFKRYDVSVIDDAETVIGRTIRVLCTDCHYGSQKVGGCAVIGRSDDEVYTERANDVGEYISGSMNLDDVPSLRHLTPTGFPPEVLSFVVRNPVPDHLVTPWGSGRRRN